MSRARLRTDAWLVADDISQAGDDLRFDWSAERTPSWAIDTGLPALAEATAERVATLDRSDIAGVVALALAQTKVSGEALKGLQRRDRAEELAAARTALSRAEQDLSTSRPGRVPTGAPKPAGPSPTWPVPRIPSLPRNGRPSIALGGEDAGPRPKHQASWRASWPMPDDAGRPTLPLRSPGSRPKSPRPEEP